MFDNLIRLSRSCPNCEADEPTIVFKPWKNEDRPFMLYGAASGVKGTQTLVTCKACSLIYENPCYSSEVITESYANSFDAGHDSQYEMRALSFRRCLTKLLPHLPSPGATVLDIGTAGGAFLTAAEELGFKAEGIEPSRNLVESGKKRGLKIHHGTLEDCASEIGTFDIVCLWDVIEHLHDPGKCIEVARQLINPGGVLLVNFPDIGTVPAKLFGKHFWWILSVHLQHFNQETITDFCIRRGFEPYHFSKYYQVLEFGYLEEMAAHLGLPLASAIHKCTPNFMKKWHIPYYASQTTMIARLSG